LVSRSRIQQNRCIVPVSRSIPVRSYNMYCFLHWLLGVKTTIYHVLVYMCQERNYIPLRSSHERTS
jgi:hypothetical protein